MWEACWSNYLTDYFHLFLCLAIIAVYADDVVAQDLRTDEMLLHFSSLGMHQHIKIKNSTIIFLIQFSFWLSNVHGWSVNFTKSSWIIVSISTIAKNSVYTIESLSTMRTRNVGLGTSSSHRVYRSH